MGWSALIMMLIQVLGPILVEWLRKWLDSRLARAAEKLPAMSSYASEHAARNALFDQAIADLPHLAYARRALLRRMKDASIDAGVTSQGAARPLTEEEATGLADLAGAAAEE